MKALFSGPFRNFLDILDNYNCAILNLEDAGDVLKVQIALLIVLKDLTAYVFLHPCAGQQPFLVKVGGKGTFHVCYLKFISRKFITRKVWKKWLNLSLREILHHLKKCI